MRPHNRIQKSAGAQRALTALTLFTVVLCIASAAGASPALASEGWWHLTSSARPTYLPPEGKGQIVLTAANRGDAAVNGATDPITITDLLPAGLKATSIQRATNNQNPVPCVLSSLTCTFTGTVPPYSQIEVVIAVEVQPGAASSSQTAENNDVAVSGGEIAGASVSQPITVSEDPTPFGLQDNELALEEEGGAPDTRAGSHPFQLTDTVIINQAFGFAKSGGHEAPQPAALPKDVNVKLPPGLVGNPIPFPQCTTAQFLTFDPNVSANACPPQTAVGVATVHVEEPIQAGNKEYVLPIFNIEPNFGEPARFGFYVPEGHVPVLLDTAVRGGPGTGEEYAITTSAHNISQTAAFLSSEVTFWGVPGDPRHDNMRGWNCLHESIGVIHGACQPLEAAHTPSFLTLPSSCGVPLVSSTDLDSWADPADVLNVPTTTPMPAMDGCNQLAFGPILHAEPTTDSASSPSGLNVNLDFNDEGLTSPEGVSESQLRDTTVVLPEGLTINPSSGVGLGGCTEADYAREAIEAEPGAGCPNNSKLGTVEIETPLLTQKIKGNIFIAQPHENPFGSLIALYIVAKNPETGIMIKLAGKVTPCEKAGEDPLGPDGQPIPGVSCQAPGQLFTTFENTPQLPFDHFNFHFREGAQAPLITPSACGTYTTTALLTSWSEPLSTLTDTSSFQVTSGVGGAACPAGGPPFAPQIAAGMLNNNAGAFSQFNLHLTRGDGDSFISAFSTTMPPGFTGVLTGIPYCPEANIEAARHRTGAQEEAAPSCPAQSLLGHSQVGTGVGAVLAYTPGKIYLAGPYNGDPFSLVSVTSAVVGPFDLGTVVVRFGLKIDPVTAQVNVDPTASEPIPTIIQGIVTHVRDIRVYIDRPNFTLNPTSCEHLSISSTLQSSLGQSATVTSPFQDANCPNLKYEPKLAVSTAGTASKVNGASLHFLISYPKGAIGRQSWMKEMRFEIPKQLPARLTTIQKACLAATFEHNRGACPAASIIGHVLVHTPVLPVPLEGPLYFVSYGGAAFPDAVAVIKGDGVTIESHGHTFINGKTGVTSATFEAVPDVPFESIEVTVPQGPFSEFGANLPHGSLNFCGQKLVMPILFKAQNGMEIHQNTPVSVSGCPKGKTRAQKLTAALKACHKKHGKKRTACEKAARKAFGARVSKHVTKNRGR